MTYGILTSEGLAHAKNNRLVEAKSCFERAIAINPNEASTYNNLGIVLGSLNTPDEAIAAFTHAIQLRPSYETAYLNLALTLMETGKTRLAVDVFLQTLALNPDLYKAQHMLGIAYFQLGQNHLALGAVDCALALNPNDIQALHNKASILTLLGRQSEAIHVYQQMLALEPTNESARYHLAKHGQADMPVTAPAGYVTDLFNQYAPTFDAQLTGQLNYQAPEQMGRLIRSLVPALQNARALDLGCGTGLVAQQLADLAIHWVGIDLSQKMLEVASHKKLYTELHCTSIADYLEQPRTPFQLMTAGDVFIYVGELTSTFAQASKHLVSGGWLVFSIESTESVDGSEQRPVVLRPSGRYAHSQSYIQQLAAQFGFTLQTAAPITLRFDGNIPIAGSVVALQKI